MGVSAGYVGMGMLAATLLSPKVNMPKPADVTPPPQAAKAPDAKSVLDAMSGTGQSGGQPGVAQTFLTGGKGVDDGSLFMGRSTLLGA